LSVVTEQQKLSFFASSNNEQVWAFIPEGKERRHSSSAHFSLRNRKQNNIRDCFSSQMSPFHRVLGAQNGLEPQEKRIRELSGVFSSVHHELLTILLEQHFNQEKDLFQLYRQLCLSVLGSDCPIKKSAFLQQVKAIKKLSKHKQQRVHPYKYPSIKGNQDTAGVCKRDCCCLR